MNHLLPILVALVLIAIGTVALVAPAQAAEMYGVPLTDRSGLAYVRGCGARDLALGVLTLALLEHARTVLLGLSLVAAADFVIVALNHRNQRPLRSLTIHGAGAIALLILAGFS